MTRAQVLSNVTQVLGPNTEIVAPTELWNTTTTTPTGTLAIDGVTSGVWYFTTNATGNPTLNFRGNSGTSLSSFLSVGEAVTFNVLLTNGATPYYIAAVQVDGSSQTPKWSGGTAPTAGNASAVDVYSFTILKTAATPTYLVTAAGPIKYA